MSQPNLSPASSQSSSAQPTSTSPRTIWAFVALVVVMSSFVGFVAAASPAAAQDIDPATAAQLDEALPDESDIAPVPAPDAIPSLDITVGGGESDAATSQPLTIVLILTVLALAPTLLIMVTSFTRTIIVLGITRSALSLQGIPPNQVLIGLSLFLTIFVMGPVLAEANDEALQPLLAGEISQEDAFDRGMEPFRKFMLQQVREADLEMFVDMADKNPAEPDDVSLTTLIPAFVVSELRAAFIIGFLVFVPFLVIDIVVSATLMSMGMVMLPPVVISLPFKLLLFVIVDGWSLLVPTIVDSFAT